MGVKNLIILLTTGFTLMGCTVTKKPQFIGVENIKITESTPKYISITANALFLNPNVIGGELQTDEIKVLINNNEWASVSTENFKVPAKKEFSIPLKTYIPTDSILSNKNIGSLIGSLFGKKLKVQYKGDIKYKILGFSHTYTVDVTDDIKIKL